MRSYQEEQDAALARRAHRERIQVIDRRARMVLATASSRRAPREELEHFAGLLNASDEDRRDIVARALELQADDGSRRLSSQEIETHMANTGRQLIPRDTRDEIRAYVAERRAEVPQPRCETVRLAVCEKFGVQIAPKNFEITYWPLRRLKQKSGAQIRRESAGRSDAAILAEAKGPRKHPWKEFNPAIAPKPAVVKGQPEPGPVVLVHAERIQIGIRLVIDLDARAIQDMLNDRTPRAS